MISDVRTRAERLASVSQNAGADNLSFPLAARKKMARAVSSLFFVSSSILASLSTSRGDVLTYHNDNFRSGLNPNEIILTASNVNTKAFGLLRNLLVNGRVYAQPLYMASEPIYQGGIYKGRHNALYVGTDQNALYCFDADSGAQLWETLLMETGEVPSDNSGCSAFGDSIGVLATPVIDRFRGVSGQIYIVTMSKTTGLPPVYHQRLWAIDPVDGKPMHPHSTDIKAIYPGNGINNDGHGHIVFEPKQYSERSALLLFGDTIYTTWASHCDQPPYSGWIIGYDRKTLTQTLVWNANPSALPVSTFLPDGSGNTFWNAGGGPAVDLQGNIYDLVANGPFDPNLNSLGLPANGDIGDAFVKFKTIPDFALADYFTPQDQQELADDDRDLGGGGPLILPDMTDASGKVRHLVTGAGKGGVIYLVDRDNLGKIDLSGTANPNVYQELTGVLPVGFIGCPAYFNGSVYFGGKGQSLKQLTFTAARLNSAPASQTSTIFNYPGTSPSVSANGKTKGIVWAYDNPASSSTTAQAILHAYNASDLSQELYNSNQNPVRDNFGVNNKFITPTISNGKVYAATQNGVGVFGLLAPLRASDVSATVKVVATSLVYNPALYHWSQTITLTNIGGASVPLPISYVIDDLDSASQIYHAFGATTFTAPLGSAFVNAPLSAPLPVGGKVTFEVSIFAGVGHTPVYTKKRVLVGTNVR
jgi:hypothetical protein